MPQQSRHQHDLVQPLVFALDRYAINPGSDDAGLAHWLYTLGTAFIFFRTAGTNPLTTAEMRSRAALLVTSVSNGTFPTCWRNFTADALRRCIAEETGGAREEEAFDDYDSIPPPPIPPLVVGEREVRKATYLARCGELKMAWRAFQPSPSVDPRTDAAKCTLINLNPQDDGRPLTDAHVADEPGQAPLQVKQSLVAKVASNLPKIRAPGSLPEDNRIITLVASHGGLIGLTAMVNACCRDEGSARSRDILAGAVRAGLLQKIDPLTGQNVGYRPLGLVEKNRCFIWACVNAACKQRFAKFFTTPLPEDTNDWQRAVDEAEAESTRCELELQAARDSNRSAASLAAATAAATAAADALAAARQPFKYVTNWCFSPKGTENLVHLVRGWGESNPTAGTLGDDVAAMYQHVSRPASFDFLRKRFPDLLAVYRFFYYHGPTIWFGGNTVPIVNLLNTDGTISTRLGSASSHGVLRSLVGGCQGDGGATLFCIGPYHEALSEAQRLHPTTDITGTADDTYACDACSPSADGGAPELFAFYEDKRRICMERVGVHSVLRKTCLMTKTGDLSAAPADIPGSPAHPSRQAIHTIKVAGTYVGQPEASSAGTLALMRARLAPLKHLVTARDGDKVTNVAQLQLNLIRLCACAIPNHWMRCCPPDETRAAAEYADDEIESAVSTVLHCIDPATATTAAPYGGGGQMPLDRILLALQCARLDSRTGGLGTSDYLRRRFATYVSSYLDARPIISHVCPAVSALPITSLDFPSTAGFITGYRHLRTTLASVRQRFARLDADSRTWIDGTVVTAYHPRLSSALELPDLAARSDGAQSHTLPRYPQRTLCAVINASAWLDALEDCHRFDADNAGAAVPRREATRLISCSQAGAGAFLMRLPDATVRGSTIPSADFRTLCQRRLGLYTSCLTVALDACEQRGLPIAQHDRLGDKAINGHNATQRHNEGLAAIYTAIRCASTTANAVRMGDKGDGTPSGKAEAGRRHAHLNDGHIPDMYRVGPPHILYEWKCYTPFKTSGAQGNGSLRHGGAASTTDGHSFAFGNTLEALRALVFGKKAMGQPNDPPLDRRTGQGRVDASPGHYDDALAKGNIVHLLATESTGALSPDVIRLLRELAKTAQGTSGHDSTVYGLSRASPKSFFPHHLAAISSAIVCADARSIRNHAASLATQLSHGMI